MRLLIKDKNKQHHLIAILLCAVSILIGLIFFTQAYRRLLIAFKELGLSLAFSFVELFDLPKLNFDFKTIINRLPILNPNTGKPTPPNILPLPESPEIFIEKLKMVKDLFLSTNNIINFLAVIIDGMYFVTIIIMIMIPFAIIFKTMFNIFYLKSENNNYNVESRQLKVFKKLVKPLIALKKRYDNFFDFLSDNKRYKAVFVFLWLFNLNVINVLISFIAYYFYLFSTMDFASLYYQVLRLYYDLVPMFKKIPLIIWLYTGLKFFGWFRRKIAITYLEYTETQNQAFISEQPIVIMLVGTMGKGKTQALTDMLLSQSVVFRNKAYELILENDLKFPNFTYLLFEKELEKRIESHEIFNLATCTRYVKQLKAKFDSAKDISTKKEVLFNYDFERYGLTYDNKLKKVSLFDVLKSYAKLYFIYICESYVISNFAIKENIDIQTLGNFPNVDIKFFDVDSKYLETHKKHCHILDFDCLRLGKKLVEDNKCRNAFEFGIISITEVGKERGNMIEHRGLKKSDDSANATNDMFNLFVKLSRHLATIDGFPFIRILTDDQRPESWGADARDLTKILHVDTGEFKLHMPLFFTEEIIHHFAFKFFKRIYKDYRFYRGDNTLIMHLIKSGFTHFHKYYNETYNAYSGAKVKIRLEEGTQEGKGSKATYYLNKKKIYSDRYNTDCFSDIFTEKALRSATGINDIACYKDTKASINDFNLQHAYFFESLQTILNEMPISKDELQYLLEAYAYKNENNNEEILKWKNQRMSNKKQLVQLHKRVRVRPA